MQAFLSDVIATLWTPVFVAIFLIVLAYASWPGNRRIFDNAAKTPLREE
jgi:cytochrome c oxidase cbb3-type subunit 4